MHIRRFYFTIVYSSVINFVIFAILNNAAQFMGKHHTLCFIHYERRMLWQAVHVYWCCSSTKGHTDIYFTIRIYGQQRQQPVASTATRQTTLHDTLSHICCICYSEGLLCLGKLIRVIASVIITTGRPSRSI